MARYLEYAGTIQELIICLIMAACMFINVANPNNNSKFIFIPIDTKSN